MVIDRIESQTDVTCQWVPISTQGDQEKTKPLADMGGKAVFIRGLEDALEQRQVDIAVHSLKDVTADLHPDFPILGCLTPEFFQDCIVFRDPELTVDSCPEGTRIGTGSMRRKQLLLNRRSDLEIVPIRGNVQTRIDQCLDGHVDAVVLSYVGLTRLGISRPVDILDPKWFIPAPGQGVICIQGDPKFADLCQLVTDAQQTKLSQVEQLIITSCHLHCGYPLGLWIESLPDSTLIIHFSLWTQDGQQSIHDSVSTHWDRLDHDAQMIIDRFHAFLGSS